MEHRSNSRGNRIATVGNSEGQLDAPVEAEPAVGRRRAGGSTAELPTEAVVRRARRGLGACGGAGGRGAGERARNGAGYAEDAKAANTRRAYRATGERSSPGAEIGGWPPPRRRGNRGAHLAGRAAAGLKASSTGRALTAIVQAHLGPSHFSPRSAGVKALHQGIRRRHGETSAQKAALPLKELRRMVEPLSDGPIGARLPLVFAGSLRRSEVLVRIVKASRPQLPGLEVGRLTGHSLRARLVRVGKPERMIMQQTGTARIRC